MNLSIETFKSKFLIERNPLFALIFKASYKEAYDFIEKKKSRGNLTFYEEFLLDYARAYIIFFQYKLDTDILNIARQLYTKCKEQKDEILLFKSIILLLEINRRVLNISEVDKFFLEGEKLIDQVNNLSEKAFYFLELNYQKSSSLTRSGKIEDAINLLKDCIKGSEKLENEYILMRSFNDIGICFGRNGNLDIAHDYFFKCLSLSQRLDSKFYIAGSNTNLAIIYQLKGELYQALKFAQEALRNNLTLNLRLYISEDYLILGRIEYSFENYNKTLEYYN